jgi:hypothetical protein
LAISLSYITQSAAGPTRGHLLQADTRTLVPLRGRWTHFPDNADSSNNTLRHEWPVMGKRQDLPLQLHSGWKTHPRCELSFGRCGGIC